MTSGYQASWSPDNSKLAFQKVDATGWTQIYTIKPDGSGLAQVTTGATHKREPVWSPDGTKIAFTGTLDGQALPDVYTMNADGTNVIRVTSTPEVDGNLDWQPIPINAYPRPVGAYPTRVSLVPAYQPCSTPNRTHGPPLGFGSCNPPSQEPGQLTVGTPDSNGQGAKSVGHLRVTTVTGNPATTADEADVKVLGNITDVRLRSGLSDYTGDLQARLRIQITDKDNTPHPGGPGAATVQEFTQSLPIPCAAERRHDDRLHLPARHHRRGAGARRGEGEAARDLAARRDPRPRRGRQPVPDAGAVRPLITDPGRRACAGSRPRSGSCASRARSAPSSSRAPRSR